MSPWFKRSAIAVAILAAAGVSTLGGAALYGDSKMHRSLKLPDYSIVLKTDAASIAHGRYLYQTKGCADCHGNDGGGLQFIHDPDTGMQVTAPNIAGGPGSAVAAYQAQDWEHVLRHGIKPNGQPVMVMPAEEYARFSDHDLEDLVAYLRQMPPVQGMKAQVQLPLVVRVLYGIGVVQDAAEKIDHSLPPQMAITPAATAEYGEYLAHGCQGCHGAHFSGGTIPGAPPTWPAAANLTPGTHSAMPQYRSVDAFKSMLRSGKRPDGSAVSTVMPFNALAQLNDTDVDALYRYLQTLPAREAGTR